MVNSPAGLVSVTVTFGEFNPSSAVLMASEFASKCSTTFSLPSLSTYTPDVPLTDSRVPTNWTAFPVIKVTSVRAAGSSASVPIGVIVNITAPSIPAPAAITSTFPNKLIFPSSMVVNVNFSKAP